ncbi:unnamed protein product [Ixodes pacificus]
MYARFYGWVVFHEGCRRFEGRAVVTSYCDNQPSFQFPLPCAQRLTLPQHILLPLGNATNALTLVHPARLQSYVSLETSSPSRQSECARRLLLLFPAAVRGTCLLTFPTFAFLSFAVPA